MENETKQEVNEPVAEATDMESAPEVKRDNTMGMLCHLLGLVQLLGVPLGNIFGPFVIWLMKKEQDPFVDECGKEALNFQISMTIYFVVAVILAFATLGLLVFLLPIVMIINIVYTIIASIRASEGTNYRYPITIRLIK